MWPCRTHLTEWLFLTFRSTLSIALALIAIAEVEVEVEVSICNVRLQLQSLIEMLGRFFVLMLVVGCCPKIEAMTYRASLAIFFEGCFSRGVFILLQKYNAQTNRKFRLLRPVIIFRLV